MKYRNDNHIEELCVIVHTWLNNAPANAQKSSMAGQLVQY